MNSIPAPGRSPTPDLFANLRNPARWRGLSMQFPHGAHWEHDTCHLVRQVVNEIRNKLVQFDAPFRAACDYVDDSKSKIEGLIVFNEAETHVVPLKLTPGLVRIGKGNRQTSIYVAHAPGPMLLVRELTDQIKRAYEYISVMGA